MEIVRIPVNPESVQLRFPPVCPHCMEAADTEWTTQFQFIRGRVRRTYSFKVPFRKACLDRREAYQKRINWLSTPVAIAVVVIGIALIYFSGSKDAFPQSILWALFGWIIPYWLMTLIANKIVGSDIADYETLKNPLVQERIGRIGQEYFDFKVARPEYAVMLREYNPGAS